MTLDARSPGTAAPDARSLLAAASNQLAIAFLRPQGEPANLALAQAIDAFLAAAPASGLREGEATRMLNAVRKAIAEILACDDHHDMDKLVSHYLGPLRAAGFGIAALAASPSAGVDPWCSGIVCIQSAGSGCNRHAAIGELFCGEHGGPPEYVTDPGYDREAGADPADPLVSYTDPAGGPDPEPREDLADALGLDSERAARLRCKCGHLHASGTDGEDAGCKGSCTDAHDWQPPRQRSRNAAPTGPSDSEAVALLRALAPTDLHDTVRDSTSIVRERFDVAIYADDYRAARRYLAAHCRGAVLHHRD